MYFKSISVALLMSFAKNSDFFGNCLEEFPVEFSTKCLSIRFDWNNDFLEKLQWNILKYWNVKFFFSLTQDIFRNCELVYKKQTYKEWFFSRSNSRWTYEQISQYYMTNFQEIWSKSSEVTLKWVLFNPLHKEIFEKCLKNFIFVTYNCLGLI